MQGSGRDVSAGDATYGSSAPPQRCQKGVHRRISPARCHFISTVQALLRCSSPGMRPGKFETFTLPAASTCSATRVPQEGEQLAACRTAALWSTRKRARAASSSLGAQVGQGCPGAMLLPACAKGSSPPLPCRGSTGPRRCRCRNQSCLPWASGRLRQGRALAVGIRQAGGRGGVCAWWA